MAPEIVPNEFSLFGTKIVPNKLDSLGTIPLLLPVFLRLHALDHAAVGVLQPD